MARRLKTVVIDINENMPGYSAIVRQERLDTDGRVGRLRIPRKGLIGNCLRVRYSDEPGYSREVFSYHTREPYRTNEDVEMWVKNEKSKAFNPGVDD